MAALKAGKVRVDINNEAYLDVVNAITTQGAPHLEVGALQPSKVLEAVCRDYARIVREHINNTRTAA